MPGTVPQQLPCDLLGIPVWCWHSVRYIPGGVVEPNFTKRLAKRSFSVEFAVFVVVGVGNQAAVADQSGKTNSSSRFCQFKGIEMTSQY